MPRAKLIPLLVAGVVVMAVIAGGYVWWTNKQRFEKTDNAYIQADTVTISPQIEGYVAEVLVADNQKVVAGQVLVRLDAAQPQAKLAQAIANVAALDAAVRGVDDRAALERAMIAQRAAGVSSAKADARRAELDLQRYHALAGNGWVSDQRLQTVRANAAQSSAAVEQAQASLQAERQSEASLGSAKAQTAAQAAAARASLEQARIEVERTVIRAPAAGVVGARAVRPGQYVRSGAALMSVVPLGETYVVANFKETQVSRIRLGQPVEIKADAFGKKAIHGRVDSFAPATGSEFALIPVENAVGNFTKIVQRVPVKIVVNSDDPLRGALRPGLSVEVEVDVRRSTGPSFAEAAPAGALVASGQDAKSAVR
jgi:membrane fusion protein (multidrug efflux system)